MVDVKVSSTNELISLVAYVPAEPRTKHPFVGRGAHAALLGWIACQNPELADQLHQEGIKPFTVSSFFQDENRSRRFLRFTGLTASVSYILASLVEKAPPMTLCLDNVELSVLEWHWNLQTHSWAGATSYQELAAYWLVERQSIPNKVVLQFFSPTTFRVGGKQCPLPLPGLIFGSLLEKWNTFAPLKLDPEVRRFAEESLLISRYQLTTCAVPLAGGMQVGFIGWCEFTAVVLDPYWLAAMNLLADFAFYAGTGAKTTMGMGQTRRIGLKERR